MYELREYQRQASDAAVRFFNDKSKKNNAIIVLPTGSGKSLVIADIASKLSGYTLIFQPSKEILWQNFNKLCSYGVLDCGIYSASFNRRNVARITFATIGSVKSNPDIFKGFSNIIVDECHYVNAKEGMYKDFFSAVKSKVLGLTATPYRLSSSRNFGSMLKFITRTRPCVFSEVLYHVQVGTLLDMGFLSKLNYYSLDPVGYNERRLQVNSTGADFTGKSVYNEFERIDFYGYLVSIVNRLLNNRVTGIKRKGIIVFTRFLKEAKQLSWSIPGVAIVSGETPAKERDEILRAFKAGEIKVVANVGVLTTGFDYSELDTVVMARPTMSLAMWYQIVGRCIRSHKDKDCSWVIDLCGNFKRFGKVEDLRLENAGNGKWAVYTNGRQLTNVIMR